MRPVFRTVKGRLFLLSLLVVFFLGCAGRLLLREPPAPTVLLTVTVCSYPEENILCASLPKGMGNATFDGIPVRIEGLSVSPYMQTECKEKGGAVSYPSALYSRLSATLLLEGELRDGHFFSDGMYLPVGKEGELKTDAFVIKTRIFDIKITEKSEF